MFVEQLIVKRKKDGPPGAWDAPISQSRPLDEAINAWVDQTGNEIVAVTAPSMFMQWMDGDRMVRLVVASVMVTYIPAVVPVSNICTYTPAVASTPNVEQTNVRSASGVAPRGWEHV